ncbi:hypothetical protein [Halorubrum tebenquichense]|uniref:Uncharacterized protein n=1 Tax=Halorubrum tebenquichense DSM 14210 TaxID=1227485 RepID=M0DW36_9EURY|nr:hypothetical protein [Halorubrum tebenquichense]ELZ39003.1 hypothetical protein C472_05661 [Halorubrum tebenquichense DSM 14210]
MLETEELYRLLEIVTLLLPVVAILLQLSIRLYRTDESEIPMEDRRESLQLGILGVIALLFAGLNTVFALSSPLYPLGVNETLLMIGIALIFIGGSVVTVGSDALRVLGGGPILPENFSDEIPDNNRIKYARQKLANWIKPEPDDTEENPE